MQKVSKFYGLLFGCLLMPALVLAQGVTTASLNGTVSDNRGQPLVGANVVAVHTPSGSIFGAVSRGDGRFNIPGMRVGGPYEVTASYIGYKTQKQQNVYLTLGQDLKIDFVLPEEAVELGEVSTVAERDPILSVSRTGAATSVSRQAIASLPTISRRIEDFARLTPQFNPAGFGFSFAGQDNRLNNITVDGSYFNNSFGLAGKPGDRTGVAPISLDAIEQLQINIAPYDVRQGNFVGAGVNTVTKSGTNQFTGSLYTQTRDQDLVGKEAKALRFNPGTFKYNQIGARLGGPIIKNKLFFFVSYEGDKLTEPGTTFRANAGGEAVTGSVTRVLASDLNRLSSFLKDSLGYETGPYQGYDHETPSRKFIAKLDFNLNNRNKLSLRYNHLDSDTDVLLSNSASLGFGTRRTVSTGLNFQNSNYIILENIRSLVGEWNTTFGANKANNLIVGYSHHDESRDSRGSFFPFVDILEGGSVYTSFGFEPFTPNNELRYSSFQVQNNFTIYGVKHNLTFGVSAERYESENVFFPGSQSVYVYNSLNDFYRDARDYIANPNRTSSPVPLRRFQVRWNNIPGQTKPIQPLEVIYAGVYAQDEWQVNKDLRLTIGLRVDVPKFGDTGYKNELADQLLFRQEDGSSIQYKTDKLPDANFLWSPRFGFNWNVTGDRTTQIRGGSGIFTGRPAYVWISNQIGNTGVLTGFEQLDNIPAGRAISAGGRPFNPNPDRYKPTNVTGAPASSYELALTDPDFKFPQLWRSNIAIDQRLPFGLIGTAEFLFNRDVNGIYYINANLPAPQTSFTGVDNRPRWTSNRIHSNVANATVLKNQNKGYSWNLAASLEKPFSQDWFAKVAYSYGEARNTVDPGSIAAGSYFGNAHARDPNNPGRGFSNTSPGHRVLAALSYRKEYFNFGGTTVSLFWEGFSLGNASYTFSGDLNGDGGTSNDLIYIPRDASEMNFEEFTASGRRFSVADQQAAWEAFIKQDKYLSANRGKYAKRNGVRLPMVFRADLSITQEVFANIANSRNSLQFRIDFVNFTNFLDKDWGVGQRMVTTTPLIARGADTQGRALYRLRNIGSELISKTFEPTNLRSDVFQIQLGLRYNFN
ncbi:MAG: carboxypeptidase regulatory-like domain-containing protein [candidate division KSB1 bacterium]|nr:carboxypeptidase regulatory-like domain-containing protein [candidate division KSB1 bacterium]MDZ7366771.1 carboxypeptidase regulatory-like domain-containing protein [candidate division KSB1 bacterium]MDZ7404783.1 carboxypeptidase regulatory-like domain-containing protein [candidate division KSB1 bacterium]